SLLALFAAAFAIGTSEFVIAGILPAVSTDLAISIPTAGLLVSLYALGPAMVVATRIVEPSRRGFAVALILAGLTVANIIGVPIGTAIGTAFGWRMTFAAVSGLGVIAFALIAVLVPLSGTGDPP